MKSNLLQVSRGRDFLGVFYTALVLSTLAVVSGLNVQVLAEEPSAKPVVATKFPALPESITSFGAAVSDGWLYVYGGNTGKTHQYSSDLQSNRFRRLNLAKLEAWEELPGEAKMQGLALVSDAGKLYRVGGFTAKNAAGEKKDLWSIADVARFDPATKTWEKLPSLPAPRSSHDAIVLDHKIYVAGGWGMQGNKGSEWHHSAVVLDLTQPTLSWKELPAPPFVRRAVSLATWTGKVCVIGGMYETGGTSGEVDYYDPATNTWQTAPDLPGDSIEGFGNSACEVGGKLFVSTIEGNVQRLDGDKWTLVSKLKHPRYFHRMLPLSKDELVFLGGTARSGERTDEIETVLLNPLPK
ncbi:MAG: Kelch repeat type 1-containing protein [Planctomycetaceae bacterium]|nr:Kelch repeat type 1-containing protein [Planctomycetaceae bacterium]